jgi:hypothetical protein
VTNHYRVRRRPAVAPVIFRGISRRHLPPTSLPLLQPDEQPRINWIKLSVTALATALRELKPQRARGTDQNLPSVSSTLTEGARCSEAARAGVDPPVVLVIWVVVLTM